MSPATAGRRREKSLAARDSSTIVADDEEASMTASELKGLTGRRVFVAIDGIGEAWAIVRDQSATMASTGAGRPERGWYLETEKPRVGLCAFPPSGIRLLKSA